MQQNQGSDYVINGHQLKMPGNCADLGVIRSSDFCYKDQINLTCLKTSRFAGIHGYHFILSKKLYFLTQLFNSLIRPAL